MTTNRELLQACISKLGQFNARLDQLDRETAQFHNRAIAALDAISTQIDGCLADLAEDRPVLTGGHIQWQMLPTIEVEVTEIVRVGTMDGMDLVLQREPDGKTVGYLDHEGFEIAPSEYEALKAQALALAATA